MFYLRFGAIMIFTESLKQNYLFRRIYRQGKRAAGKRLVVYCRKNRLQKNRLGITASTKLGHAVVRNKVRRRIREAYRLAESHFHPGFDIVIVARSLAVQADYAALSGELYSLCRRLNIMEEDLLETSASVDDSVLPK